MSDGVEKRKTPAARTFFRLRAPASQHLPQKLRTRPGAGEQIIVIRSRQDEPRTKLDVAARILLVVDAAHAERLAVGAAGGGDRLIGFDYARVADLAGNPQFGGQVRRADEQRIDPIDRRDG